MSGDEYGTQELFRTPLAVPTGGGSSPARPAGSQAQSSRRVAGGLTVEDTSTSKGWGRGPRAADPRKFKYDRDRVTVSGERVEFSVSKADRMDAEEAGDVLHRIHEAIGIQNETEVRLKTFDDALFFQHFINGASMMQPDRGKIVVDGMDFDISKVLGIIGAEKLRRFFRTYADNVVEAVRDILDSYDPYDYASCDKVGQIREVAAKRGLSKFPEYAADSAEACTEVSEDVRRALLTSKAMVLPSDDVTMEVKEAAAVREANDK